MQDLLKDYKKEILGILMQDEFYFCMNIKDRLARFKSLISHGEEILK